jgi:hypothetical protein
MSTLYPRNAAELAQPWEEVSEARYFDQLGAVPPERQSGRAFAVGEALCHTDDGQVVHAMFVEVGLRFWTRPGLLVHFDPIAFASQVRRQLGLPN